ncbi:MAG: tetratricopeptide repeat protein [Actinomycetota bacterium]
MNVRRPAAVSLSPEAEEVWGRLRAEIRLNRGFWLAYIFGAEFPEAQELIARADDLARLRVGYVERIDLAEGPQGSLSRLVGQHLGGLLATFVLDSRPSGDESIRDWTEFIRRLNERRDVVARAHPGGLILLSRAALLPVLRDDAPDLWSFRSLTVLLGSDSMASAPERAADPVVRRTDPHSIPGEPLVPSQEVLILLQQSRAALSKGSADQALALSQKALERSTGEDDRVAIDSIMALAQQAAGEKAEAQRLAGEVLASGRRLDDQTNVSLLVLLLESPKLQVAEWAAGGLVKFFSGLVEAQPDAIEALRDLSVSLNNVGDIQRLNGNLSKALAAFTESLELSNQIRQNYGDTPESLRDLSVSLDKVGDIQRLNGNLSKALAAFTESLELSNQIRQNYGDTPESLRDLSVSLDNLAVIKLALDEPEVASRLAQEADQIRELAAQLFGAEEG